MRYIRRLKDNILCTVYYEPIMGGKYYVIEFPAEKKIYFAKRGKLRKTVGQLCEKLFSNFPLQREHLDTTPSVMKALDYARTVIHYISTANMADDEAQKMVQEGVVNAILLPLLEQCRCADRTKEFFLKALDDYLQGRVTQTELAKMLIRRFIKVTKKLKTYKIKFY